MVVLSHHPWEHQPELSLQRVLAGVVRLAPCRTVLIQAVAAF